MIKFEFDCTEDGFVGVFNAMADRGLNPQLIAWRGPGGGNPQCTIEGTHDQIKDALIKVMHWSPQDVDDDIAANY